jgi:hypothetical protein
MAECLQGLKIALVGADGVGQTELEASGEAVRDAGAQTQLLSLRAGHIESLDEDLGPVRTYTVDQTVAQATVGEYDALLLVPGTANPIGFPVKMSWSPSCVTSSLRRSQSALSAMTPGLSLKREWHAVHVSRCL